MPPRGIDEQPRTRLGHDDSAIAEVRLVEMALRQIDFELKVSFDRVAEVEQTAIETAEMGNLAFGDCPPRVDVVSPRRPSERGEPVDKFGKGNRIRTILGLPLVAGKFVHDAGIAIQLVPRAGKPGIFREFRDRAS